MHITKGKQTTFCYRTLEKLNDPRWPNVHRITTYSKDRIIRQVVLIDPTDGSNPLNPNVSKLHYLTHFPKDPKCDICDRCKCQKKQCGSTFVACSLNQRLGKRMKRQVIVILILLLPFTSMQWSDVTIYTLFLSSIFKLNNENITASQNS